MRYLATGGLLVLLVYMFSFAGCNWRKGEKLAAVGTLLLVLAACGLSLFVLFSGFYEL